MNQLRRIQLTELEILKFIDKTCEELGLKYSLGGGSMLGAIRHKGFIPWDPDIDIVMFREDYERFCSYCEEHNSDGSVFIDDYRTEKNHISSHAIIRIPGTHVIHHNTVKRRYVSKNDGIYIDVFPLDNVPDNTNAENKQINDIKRIERLMALKQAPKYKEKTHVIKSFVKNIVSDILLIVSMRFLNKMRDTIMRRYEYEKTKRVAVFVDPAKYNHKTLQFPVEWFGNPVRVDFEGKKYNAPAEYDNFLRKRYGDYMKLPPENECWSYLDNVLEKVDYGTYTENVHI